MHKHNLDQDDQEYFIITAGGKDYQVRYPTTAEVQESLKIEEDTKKEDWLYALITPVEKDSPPIRDVLKKSSIKKMQRFNEAILKEFGIG